MTKMIGKILIFVAFAALAKGYDAWDECIKQVTAKGDPSIDVPPHDPYILISQNISRTIEFMGVEVDFSVSNLKWYNIPWWNVTKYEKISEDDTTAVYEYDLYWSYFTLTGNYEVKGELASAEVIDDVGEITISMKHVDWVGTYNTTKDPEYINRLNVTWLNKELTVNVTGLGFFEELFDTTLEAAIALGFNYISEQNYVGQAFQYQLNNRWLNNTERMDGLKAWCAENVANTTELLV